MIEDRYYRPYPWDTTAPCPSQENSADLPPIKFYPGARIDSNFEFRPLPFEPLFKVKLLNPKAKVPTKSYEGDSGWDLYSVLPYTLWQGHVTVVKTGIAIQPRKGLGWIVKDRSSMALAGVFTHGGVGDNGYRGEISVSMTCEDPQYYINAGDKIAQIVFHPVPEGGPVVVDELDPSERGEKHWGSSGR